MVDFKNSGVWEGIDFGKYRGLFTDLRVDHRTIPGNLYVYDCRHGDNGFIRTLENRVVVNHGGTIVTNVPVVFAKGRDFYTLNNWSFTGESCTATDMTTWFKQNGNTTPITSKKGR